MRGRQVVSGDGATPAVRESPIALRKSGSEVPARRSLSGSIDPRKPNWRVGGRHASRGAITGSPRLSTKSSIRRCPPRTSHLRVCPRPRNWPTSSRPRSTSLRSPTSGKRPAGERPWRTRCCSPVSRRGHLRWGQTGHLLRHQTDQDSPDNAPLIRLRTPFACRVAGRVRGRMADGACPHTDMSVEGTDCRPGP